MTIKTTLTTTEKSNSPWQYEGSEWQPPEEFSPDDAYGMVYMITNRATSRKYVGKKFFWSQKTLPITKKRKRRKKTLVESDWRTYWGSNKHLVADLETQGPDTFYREILHLCKAKGELSYMEAKEQFEREVLLTEEYYNGIKIGRASCRERVSTRVYM
jgi:hypothetical protein